MASFTAKELFITDDDHPSLKMAVYNKIDYRKSVIKHFATRGVRKATMVSLIYENFYASNNCWTDVMLSFIYVLPNSNNRIYEEIGRYLKSHIDVSKMIIMGDFNRHPNKMKDFMKHLTEFQIEQKIVHPTHDQSGTLDHIYTNIHADDIRCGVLNTLTKTDHRPIYISIKKN